MKYPVWAWNGWSEQDVCSGLSRREIVRAILRERHDKKWGDYFTVTATEDEEHLTVVVVLEYDYYGWRRKRHIYTTRAGEFVPDEDDNLVGDWVETS